MSSDTFNSISRHLKTAPLPVGMYLEDSSVCSRVAYFLSDGVASQILITGNQAHISIIGREGLVAPAALIGGAHRAVDTIMQVAGSGLCIPTSILASAANESPPLRDVLRRYAQVREIEAAQALVLEAQFTADERTARWILMCHDRVDGDLFPLSRTTIAFLAGVADEVAAQSVRGLERLSCIRATNGWIEVRDREGLTRAAGRSYGLVEKQYQRLVRAAPR